MAALLRERVPYDEYVPFFSFLFPTRRKFSVLQMPFSEKRKTKMWIQFHKEVSRLSNFRMIVLFVSLFQNVITVTFYEK